MQISLTFMETISLIALILGGVFALLKIAAYQFLKNISSRFTGMESGINDKITVLTDSMSDKMKLHRAEIELATERRHSLYLEKFYTVDAANTASLKMDKVTSDIFALLHSIDDKFDRTVSREDCNSKRAGGQP